QQQSQPIKKSVSTKLGTLLSSQTTDAPGLNDQKQPSRSEATCLTYPLGINVSIPRYYCISSIFLKCYFSRLPKACYGGSGMENSD
ncbi:hypothetical protein, partial [Arthrobacter terrae]|uniref:hypothetical protein n=1 Tax=Arthrobacter terrae TaxID=2935737 RepID=UPI001E560FAB